MLKRNRITSLAMGVLMLGAVNVSTVFAAQATAAPVETASVWTCPNGYEDCPGEEYCQAHDQCVTDGYCVHNNCRTGYSNSTTQNSNNTGNYSGHHSRGHHGGRGGCHR